MRLLSALVLSFLFTFQVAATDFVVPNQKIVGAEDEIAAGDLIVLTVSDPEKKPDFMTEVQYNWTVMENGKVRTKGIRVSKDKTEVFWGAGVKSTMFTVFLNRTFVYQVKETVELKDGSKKEVVKEIGVKSPDVMVAEIKIEGVNPTPVPPQPNPNPTPNPNPVPVPPTPKPEPVFPVTKYNLSKFVFDNAKTLVKLDAPNLSRTALALANSVELVGSQIASGSITDVKVALTTVAESNKNALGANRAEWQGFSSVLTEKLYALYKTDGTLRTLDDFKNAFFELRDGFKAVATYYGS